jgi:hypothetical protein
MQSTVTISINGINKIVTIKDGVEGLRTDPHGYTEYSLDGYTIHIGLVDWIKKNKSNVAYAGFGDVKCGVERIWGIDIHEMTERIGKALYQEEGVA